jgi:hypothetical protein
VHWAAVVEKLVFCTNDLKSGDRKCLPGLRKSLVGYRVRRSPASGGVAVAV